MAWMMGVERVLSRRRTKAAKKIKDNGVAGRNSMVKRMRCQASVGGEEVVVVSGHWPDLSRARAKGRWSSGWRVDGQRCLLCGTALDDFLHAVEVCLEDALLKVVREMVGDVKRPSQSSSTSLLPCERRAGRLANVL